MNSRAYDVHLRDIRKHPRQREFVESAAKRKVIRAGRRGGKTTGVAVYAVLQFLKGRRVLYAAPTQDQVQTFWWEVKNALREPLDAGALYKNETEHIVEVPGTKQRIRAKTAWNADTLRGDYADDLILDEYQLMAEDAWGVVGAPMLMDNNGNATFIYTPPSIRSAGVSKAKDKRHASKLYKRAAQDNTGRWAVFHFSSHDNPFIDKEALAEISQDMTSLAYRQEIMAEDVDEVPGALWTRDTIDKYRVASAPEQLSRIVVAVDPSISDGTNEETNEAGIVVAGIDVNKHGRGYVLADLTLHASPDGWARRAVSAYHGWEADAIIAEDNQGGEMVRLTIKTVDPHVPVRLVHAKRGKKLRAQPVSALYEQGRVSHVGVFAELEDQMCSWLEGDDSPDRMDALVHVLTDLMVGEVEPPTQQPFMR